MFNRYYGFVNFDKPEAAVEARNSLNGVSLGGGKQARLYVTRFQNKAERQASLSKSETASSNSCSFTASSYPSGSYMPGSFSPTSAAGTNEHGRNVYVKHLAPEVDESILYQVFQACASALVIFLKCGSATGTPHARCRHLGRLRAHALCGTA